ncbi:MAG TPA: flagellar hook-associated protein FlgL [Tepidisphaeraceae bacterium]|nr:flagellar hook-associated protein FlgL [Tepidisphaeraceae bacterium]
MAILPLQLARVSNLLQTQVTQSTIAQTQEQLLQVQNELSTGKKLNLPSDDPGQAAIAQQIRKLLEQRQAYSSNLASTNSKLGEVDTTLGSLSDLIRQAQTIASANVGSDVSDDARQSAASVVDALYNQLMSLGNTQFDGVYIFGGDRSTEAPFVENNGGVEFVGTGTVLKNVVDENASLPFMANGSDIFGAISSRMEGTADVSPSLTLTTRLSDLRGTSGDGVRLGSIRLGNGSTSLTVDLSHADTVGDVITAINNAGVGSITASLSPTGMGIQLTGGGADNISVNEVGGGTTASDLGILQTSGAGAGNSVVGSSLRAEVTLLTPLANLKAGAGIDTAGLIITNGLTTKTIDLSTATTVQDMLNAINGSGAAVRAEINSAGTGINILNPTQGTNMMIAENGGTTAADLGVRSFSPSTQLSELNSGLGVRTAAGPDIQITDSNGVQFQVDLDNLNTVQDVLDAINTAAASAGAGVTAGFSTTGNGITLTDTAGGAGTIDLQAQNFSNAKQDLGLTANAVGGVITGSDVNPIDPGGIFSHLGALRDALRTSDLAAITQAATGLQEDYDRVVRIRGQNGAQVQEVQSRQQRLDDQNVTTKALLSQLEDVDFTDAVSRFQTLQTALQAGLQTSAQVLNLSLLDFLG